MKSGLFFFFSFLLLTVSAQNEAYLKPEFAVVYNSFNNTTECFYALNISTMFGMYIGYEMDNNLVLESGIVHQNVEMQPQWNFFGEQVSSKSTYYSLSSVAHLNIPFHLKYNYKPEFLSIHIEPYLGCTYSHYLNNIGIYETKITTDDLSLSNDTLSIINSEGLKESVLLLNFGLSIEYDMEFIVLALSANYAFGFSDIAKSTLYFTTDKSLSEGEIFYQGDKFYLALGIKIPFGRLASTK